MNFVKYRSIQNSYRQETIDKFVIENKTNGVWLVTEKIHGANFSFWYDGKKLRLAKRTCWIADDDNFFGIQKIKEDLIRGVKLAYARCKSVSFPKSDVKYMAFFGELFGGSYPHKDVPVDPNAKKVQKGVYYSPENEFMVFDIKVNGEFLKFDEMQQICEDVKLNYVKALHVGDFESCIQYKNMFQTTIPEEFDLPEIEDNICEGVIIRPNKPQFLFDHTSVMLKNKNERFAEKERAPKKKIVIELSEIENSIIEVMRSMITGNRYDSVVSKIGEVTIKDFGKLQGLLAQDILEEFTLSILYKDYNILEKAEQKRLRKMLGYETAKLVKKKLIRGE